MQFQESLQQLLSQTIGLLTILNPIAGATMMVSMTGTSHSDQEVENTARRTTLTVFIASVATVALGELIFNFFGINTYSIEVIGGLVILRMSMKMIEGDNSMNHSPAESKEAIEKTDVSVIPLGIPVFFGPGAMATLILFKSQGHDALQLAVLVVAIVLASLAVYIALRNAKLISRKLGVTGMKISTRLLGLVLGAIAVQFIVSGLYTLWPHLQK